MLKIAKVWIAGMVILMSGISMSFAYTDEELAVLAEDCATSLALQRKFQSNKLLMYHNIQLKTGDNCANIIRQSVVRYKSDEYVKLWDKVMKCTRLSQNLINENGGLSALPLPAHLKQQYLNHKIDGQLCFDITKEIKKIKQD